MSDSNSPETLNLIAHELEALLTKFLGHDTFYVLVVSKDLGPDSLCNCLSNVPPDRADQLRAIFGELSKRQPQFMS